MPRKELKNNRQFFRGIGKSVGKGLILLIRLYQKLLSPFLGRCCRFEPSCSEYAVEAIKRLGPVKGIVKAGLRLLRCNPLFKGGYDPVSGRQP
jgi:putative membrane protein insertion efficiency factor